jgi:hypothetical protein
MASSPHQPVPLPGLPTLVGQVVEDDYWRAQKQRALQVAIACQIFHAERGKFPTILLDALEILGSDTRVVNRMKRNFTFIDPCDGKTHAWIYFPRAKSESAEVLISSPMSDHRLRVVCSAVGHAAVVTEDAYHAMRATHDPS